MRFAAAACKIDDMQETRSDVQSTPLVIGYSRPQLRTSKRLTSTVINHEDEVNASAIGLSAAALLEAIPGSQVRYTTV